MSSKLVNLPEMPSQLILGPVVKAELEKDKRTQSVLKTLSIVSAQQEKQRSVQKQGAIKRNAKEKVSKFNRENRERLASMIKKKEQRRTELIARLRQLRQKTTETYTRIEEILRTADEKIEYLEKDVSGVEADANDLIGHLRESRERCKGSRVEDEQAVVRDEIKNKLAQLDAAMHEWIAKHEVEDNQALLLVPR